MRTLGLLSFFLLVAASFVHAFGVTTFYWEGNPLVMSPGETIDLFLLLQNMVGEQDMTLKAQLEEGKELATLTDSNLNYVVPYGRKDIKVNLRITIPRDTSFVGTYHVGVSFTQVLQGEGKMLQMAGAVKTYIPIVIKNPNEATKLPEVRIEAPQQPVAPEEAPQQKIVQTKEKFVSALKSMSTKDKVIAGSVFLAAFILYLLTRRARKKHAKKRIHHKKRTWS